MSDTAPPGWYPDASGTQRYWDGSRWLDTPPAAPPAAPQGGPGPRSWAEGGYGGGFGGGFGGPPPRPRRSRAVLYAVLGVVAVVLVAALIITLVLVTGGDDTDEQAGDGTSQTSGPDGPGDGATTDEPEESEPAEDDRPDPADTVREFVDAAIAGDCDALEDLVTDDFLGQSGECDPDDVATGDLDDVDLEVGDATVEGDTATVVLSTTYQGESTDSTLELVYEDDAWLIDGFGLPDAPTASAPTLPSPS